MTVEPIKIAILAMGGEGGGVLADWIVDLGEANGYFAQTTSVPGVAQRTGATIYYVELFPGAADAPARAPVLALMPMPGDVDVVLASELMEAGRAVQRGFVTRERTTLIASSHRVYSIAEKSAMGDGRVDSDGLARQAREAARHFFSFDMAEAAERAGSVVSAVLFGALSGSGVLPFSREQFEATIERGGVGVKPSLKAFDAGYARARPGQPDGTADAPRPMPADAAPAPRDPAVAVLLERARRFAPQVSAIAIEGVRRLIDYQDPAYAGLYLDRLDALSAAPGGSQPDLLGETARHLALWMSYEDTIRVADLKTRGSRFERVRGEVRAKSDQLLQINEFMHPRIEEICETLPAGLGRWLARPHWAHRLVARFTRQGRVVKTSSLGGFLLLYTLARWGRWRRTTLRYALENARIEAWLRRVRAVAAINPALALETAQCQRLVKGYGDTHARGLKHYETLMTVVDRHADTLPPQTLRELRDAALADEHGNQLRACLQRHAFSVEG
ncbi:indolepyruvate oxidoreductase subunit beta family protein [Ralstonia pseudosolanacearum]|uniref:Indolepyruvate:ferredoxin oxidoreductase oxidoreductase protein n=1 Tax=Ralstonia nicotianae (strain ATCC BAA-1114 / GMI1000) TaxID=267608 RepID=Q8XYD0_RALN1|nr:indolepyruvate oxidoreductase subunit beta family protein [Ralstonia pseudosolanacearum]AST27398.1 indolepyruvate oxidoreductase subunit B [Ralstonia pseudosolanacearum]MDC6283692.1 indolepyruvate oxidoreductase subunit beta family protein [Ralstonia pseudosolanacearum]CAD15530.1 putative indolepyruvate:ferredoxin oxidoreductase oxidoreductase protein [Ralstonia pseudosolanacearum GMI1000]